MLFTPEAWTDIRKYYEGSYVKFLEYGDSLFYIEKVRENAVMGVREDSEPFLLSLDHEAPYNLTYTLPHKGLFLYNGSAHMLHRIPAVQYSRGLTTANTKIVEVSTGKPQSINFDTLKAYVQKQPYVSLNVALYGKSDAVSMCLSRRFSFYRPKQLVYVDSYPVALFQRKTNTLVPYTQNCRQFFPELKSLIDPSEGKYPQIKLT